MDKHRTRAALPYAQHWLAEGFSFSKFLQKTSNSLNSFSESYQNKLHRPGSQQRWKSHRFTGEEEDETWRSINLGTRVADSKLAQ